MSKMAASSKVLSRSDEHQVEDRGYGWFRVTSTSGSTYTVRGAIENGVEKWECRCKWAEYHGTGCSHVRAAKQTRRRGMFEVAIEALPIDGQEA